MTISNSLTKKGEKLRKSEYSLDFEEIFDSSSNVRFEKYGDIPKNFTIYVDDKNLKCSNSNDYQPILADILDIAVAIHVSDRVCDQKMEYPAREITVYLPLRKPQIFNKKENLEKIKELLFWATGTDWIFIFKSHSRKPRFSEKNRASIQFPIRETEVALWSGGLDALAGLYYRFKETPEKEFTLLGSGSKDNMFGKQKAIRNALPKELKGNTKLFQIPIRLFGIDEKDKNYFMRSRGVVFALIGSVVATLQGQSKLHIYENGIGAFNLPYSESSIGMDHSRSVHPITLSKVSVFVSNLLKKKFEIINPFLYSTKAETLKYLHLDKRLDLVNQSMSCDRPHREVIVQCGYCSSCILRRLSIYNAEFDDTSMYKIMDLKSAKKDKKKYFEHMDYQVSRIKKALDSQNTNESKWEAFSRLFPDLDEVIDLKYEIEKQDTFAMKNKILKTYENHIKEWKAFYASI